MVRFKLNHIIEATRNRIIDDIFHQRFKSITGFLILLFVSSIITIFIYKVNSFLIYIPLIGIIGLMCFILIVGNVFFAVSLAIVISIISNPINKYLLNYLPFGTIVDLIIVLSFVGCLGKQLREKKWSVELLSHQVTVVQLLFFLLMIVEAFNINMHSYEGYFAIVRRAPIFIFLYFIVAYELNDRNFVKKFLILWFIVALLNALYGVYQEIFGLADFEMRYLNSDEGAFKRVFIEGRFRKFSLFNDPTSFGIFMTMSGLFFMILSISYPTSLKKKILLFIGSLVMFVSMAFSGTRTAYAMLPAGILIYTLMTITQKRTLILTSLVASVFVIIIYGPIYGNKTINRIRSTFSFSDDASLSVRDVNRAFIQPYIYEHPIGGGIGTSGVPGKIFNPNHYLAGFPPDSAYLQVALEFGYVGFFIMMITMYVYIRTIIKGYYQSKSPKIKAIYIALSAVVFSIIIAQYTQYALSFTNRLFFIVVLALRVYLRWFDKKENE